MALLSVDYVQYKHSFYTAGDINGLKVRISTHAYCKFTYRFIFLRGAQNSLSGNIIGATKDQRYRAAVAHPVTILTHTEGQPTSTSFPLSPTEVDHPVRSIAEYMLAREKMIWKKEYEYVTGLAFSFSSFSSVLLSNGSRGFPEPSSGNRKIKERTSVFVAHGHRNACMF